MARRTAPGYDPAVSRHGPATADPGRLERAGLLALLVLGVWSFAWFAEWWFQPHHALNLPLFAALTFSAWYAGVRSLVNWYAYAYILSPYPREAPEGLRAAVLTTACPGEPYGMIREALERMVAIRYPHRTCLLDEANDPALLALCRRLGVTHITRESKVDAKAGNVNHALRFVEADYVTIFDPDHRPDPGFLDRVLGHFADEGVGIVQTVQAYYNQGEGPVPRAAAEQTYGFYGPILMGMHGAGCSLVIGTNCTFRRAALDSIGGHQAGLAEDLHTSMALHSAGWQSVYVPEVLARGLVPSDVLGYLKQQLKWSRGCFELLLVRYLPLWSGWTFHQRLSYFMIGTYYLLGLATAVNQLLPVLFLWTGAQAAAMDLVDFAYHYAPFLVVAVAVHLWSARWFRDPSERVVRWRGALLLLGSWPIYVWGLVLTLLRVDIPYLPTPKTGERVRSPLLALPQAAVGLASLAGLGVAWVREGPTSAVVGMGLFAALNLAQNAFVAALLMGWIGQPRPGIVGSMDWGQAVQRHPYGTCPEVSPAPPIPGAPVA